uniref:HDC09065 n=1 Tax=Drosophila melanogaster TaxID=7227 RepID=Q6ILL5_DROME|nr:TPA_inf: HDC09065 [Drosophila melanogaster]
MATTHINCPPSTISDVPAPQPNKVPTCNFQASNCPVAVVPLHHHQLGNGYAKRTCINLTPQPAIKCTYTAAVIRCDSIRFGPGQVSRCQLRLHTAGYFDHIILQTANYKYRANNEESCSREAQKRGSKIWPTASPICHVTVLQPVAIAPLTNLSKTGFQPRQSHSEYGSAT